MADQIPVAPVEADESGQDVWGKLNKKLPTIIITLLVLFFGMRILDWVMLWGIYSEVYSTIQEIGGLPGHLTGALSVAAMTIVALTIRFLIWNVVMRRTARGTVVLGILLTSWMLFLYFISIPSPGEYFNRYTGQPRYVCGRDFNGRLEVFELGMKFHPRTGEKLGPVTKDIVRELLGYGPSSSVGAQSPEFPPFQLIPAWVGGREGGYFSERCLSLSVESVQLNQKYTVVHVAVRNMCQGDNAVLYVSDRGDPKDIYLLDSAGSSYSVESPKGKLGYTVKEGETYRFPLTFGAVPPGTRTLTLYHYPFTRPIKMVIQR